MSHKKHLLLLTEAQIMFFFLKAQAKQAASVRFCLFIYIDVYLKLEPYLHILFPPIPQPLEKYRKEKKNSYLILLNQITQLLHQMKATTHGGKLNESF